MTWLGASIIPRRSLIPEWLPEGYAQSFLQRLVVLNHTLLLTDKYIKKDAIQYVNRIYSHTDHKVLKLAIKRSQRNGSATSYPK